MAEAKKPPASKPREEGEEGSFIDPQVEELKQIVQELKSKIVTQEQKLAAAQARMHDVGLGIRPEEVLKLRLDFITEAVFGGLDSPSRLAFELDWLETLTTMTNKTIDGMAERGELPSKLIKPGGGGLITP